MTEKHCEISLCQVITEPHGTQMNDGRFCDVPSLVDKIGHYFATVGRLYISIYRLSRPSKDLPSVASAAGFGCVEVVQVYIEEDNKDEKEDFYCCTWGPSEHNHPLVAAAGMKGVVRILDLNAQCIIMTLVGHGHAINIIRWHHLDYQLLLSASRDHSIRLWNVCTGQCLVAFAGHGGHIDSVLHLDIHPSGHFFASASIDTTVHIWSLESESVQSAILASKTHSEPNPLVIEQFPIFSCNKIHIDFVDCVSWLGNLLLSKSTDNCITLWCPDPDRDKDAICVLKRFEMDDCEIWFVRFHVCIEAGLLAVGSKTGKIFVWSLDDEDDQSSHSTKNNDRLGVDNRFPDVVLSHPYSHAVIRSVCFSCDGEYIISTSDDAIVSLWKIQPIA